MIYENLFYVNYFTFFMYCKVAFLSNLSFGSSLSIGIPFYKFKSVNYAQCIRKSEVAVVNTTFIYCGENPLMSF